MADQNYELFRATPRSKTAAQQSGGMLGSLMGDYAGGNVWDTQIGKQMLPAMGMFASQNPLLGGGLLALGMGPKDWRTLMVPQGGAGSTTGQLGGFTRSQYKPGPALASYGNPQQTGQQPAVRPQPPASQPMPQTTPQPYPMTRASAPTMPPSTPPSTPSLPRTPFTPPPVTPQQIPEVAAVTPRPGLF